MNVVDPGTLRRAGYDFKTPFAINLNSGEILVCTSILRLLPGKRIVCKANLQSRPVIAKIFVNPIRAACQAEREIDGLDALYAADIAAPGIINKAPLSNGAIVLMTEYIEGAVVPSTLLQAAVEEEIRKNIFGKIFKMIARFHKAGLCQNDLHLDNFILKDDELYAIDTANLKKTAAPVSSAAAIENLQFFFAQFEEDLYPLLLKSLGAYTQINPDLSVSEESFLVGARKKRRWVWNKFAKKIFRNSTGIMARRTYSRSLLCKREYYTSPFIDFLNNLDSAIEKATLLKKGHSSTVALVEIIGRQFVVKRYNIKNHLKLLRRQFPPSRAQRSWLYAHLLGFHNISTPKPIAMLEKRLGPLRSTGYFITEYIKAPNVIRSLELVKDEPKAQYEILVRFAQIVKKLAEHNISHGDFKATNFLDTPPTVSIVDLDAMTCHRCRLFFKKAHKEDRLGFIENFDPGTTLYDLAKTALSSL
ncbi:MAG: lipopolysaccharide kinase InaA family protein [Planctomycetota bacterium]|jgi:tRNA A-37 threonylcarbamoyl transferase component Bud32